MKTFLSTLTLFFCMLFSISGFCQENIKTVADIKTELIRDMIQDGYLSEKMGKEVSSKYIKQVDIQQTLTTPEKLNTQKANGWQEYISWINFFKVAGVALLIFACFGFIKKIMLGLWTLIVVIPVFVYQLLFFSVSLTATFMPEIIWSSQAFYIALLGSFTNIAILSWIIASYKNIQLFLARFFNLGIPIECILSFWAMVYFAGLAFLYHSSIFGLFAAIGLSGIFSFCLLYSPGVLTLYFKENMLTSIVIGHLIVLGIYCTLYTNNVYPEYLQYFNVGIQYYCTIALSVALLVGASPFVADKNKGLYLFIFILISLLSTFGYYFWNLQVMASIILCFALLLVLEWIGYIGYKGGFIIGSGVLGCLLYGCSLLLEKYGPMIMLSIN